MTNLRHFDDGSVRFVTWSTFRREPTLISHGAADILLAVVEQFRTRSVIRVFGFVIMPEHVHFVLHVPEGERLGLIVGQIKSLAARSFFKMRGSSRARGRNVLWQVRCYDHNCRSREAVLEKIQYCHNNPVKRGLARDASEWQWSSAAWYEKRQTRILGVDELEE